MCEHAGREHRTSTCWQCRDGHPADGPELARPGNPVNVVGIILLPYLICGGLLALAIWHPWR